MLKEERQKLSFFIFSILLVIILIIFLSRIFFLAFFPTDQLKKFVKTQYNRVIALSARRGDILDSKGNSLAVSISLYSIFADPYLIDFKDKQKVSKKLSKYLNLNYQRVYNKIKSKRRFVWLKRKISDLEYKKVKDILLKYQGLNYTKEPKRAYPNNKLASHVLGFVNIDSKGVSGVESYYEQYLKGDKSKYKVKYKRDAKGRVIFDNGKIFESIESANSVYLTIDLSVQYQIEMILKEAQEFLKAKSITSIVMDPYSGEIFSLANIPNFNPNHPGKYPVSFRRNRAITDVYEPGSTFKIITAGIALKNHLVKPTTKIWCENGHFDIGGRIIKEAEGHNFKWLSVRDVIAHSSNVGAAKLSFMIGFDKFLEGIKLFGIGERTGIDLPGEVRGLVRRKFNKVMLATMGFGQGIAVTPIQILRAYAVVANGGHEIIPHVVKKISRDGKILFNIPSDYSQVQLIHKSISKELKEMLRLVVSQGTGTGTNIKGFNIVGKTGTAQKPDMNHGGYYKNKFILSFAGFFPMKNPKYVMIVVVDDPEKGKYASTVAVPVFRRISNVLIQNMGINIKKINVSKKLNEFLNKTRFKIKSKTNKIKVVPSFIGETLRNVSKNLKGEWKDILVSGVGTVYKQEPKAKTPYKDNLILHLYLK